MKKAITILTAVLLPLSILSAQEQEYGRFKEAAKEQCALYCGKQATLYSNIRYNGNPYWKSPEFVKGDIEFNGKLYRDVLLNIDACQNEVLVKYAPGMGAVAPDRDAVPSFTMGGEKFVNLRLMGVSAAAEGFYQILAEKPTLVLFRVGKNIQQSSDNVNGSRIGYKDPGYNPNYINFFAMRNSWYELTADGKFRKISQGKAKKLTRR